jgi:hypothetical protein
MKWPPHDLYLSNNCLYCRSCLTSNILSHVNLGGFPAESEISGPYSVETRAIRRFARPAPHRLADDGVAAREDADQVGAEADLLVQRFLRVVAQDCGQTLRGKDVNARMSSRAWSRLGRPASRGGWRGLVASHDEPEASRETSRSRTGARVRSHALPVAPWSPLSRTQRQGLNCH